MRKSKQNGNQMKLFDLSAKNTSPEKETEPKKKRGRPPKSTTTVVETEKQKPQKPAKEIPWKDFSKSKPEFMHPCEFYVDTGNGKIDIFYGYVEREGINVTDEPYKMRVLRKKHGNLHYREIAGCKDVSNCPRQFPDCKNCKQRKKA